MHPLGFISLLLIAGLVYVLILVVALMWGLTHPPRHGYSFAVARGIPGSPDEIDPPLKFDEWQFVSRGRTLDAWDIAGRNPAGPTIVFAHGWGDSRIGSLVRVAHLADAASRMIAWDLPGHGEAPGICRLGKFEADDVRALLDSVGGPVVLFGWSLGAGLCIEAGDDARVTAVIAEAPYRFQDVPARNVLRLSRLPSGFPLDIALALLGMKGQARRDSDRAGFAARLTCPLLVLLGTEDEVSPPADGREIAKAAPNATLVEIEGGDHNALWVEPEWARVCGEAVHGFLADRS